MRIPLLMLAAWTAFVVAWFLPVIDVPVIEGGGTLVKGVLPGWQAFRIALAVDPSSSWLGSTLSIAAALTNALMLVSPVVLLAAPAGRPIAPWLGWGFVAATLLDLVWVWPPMAPRGALRVGYWLWVGSFGLAALTLLRAGSRRPP